MLKTIRLDGLWQFCADGPERYTDCPPPTACFTDTISLPGTTAQSGKGTPNPAAETGCLTEVYPYRGNAWFLRTVDIPPALRGKRCRLFLERTRCTALWVNGVHMGTQNSLCTPHVYDLSALTDAESLRLCICVNNAHYPTKGGHMTSPDTQTNWNGITGELSLRFYDSACILHIQAEPDAAARQVTLHLETAGRFAEVAVGGRWVSLRGTEALIPARVLPVTQTPDGASVVVPLGAAAPLWDEYDPVIARLTLLPAGSSDAAEVCFGLTDFRAEERCFTSHGRPVFLRGKHDGMLFPLTGAAPTTVDEWLHVMGIAKAYGINHYRFHTCCPPDAAFTAADLLGIWMEPELPFWGSFHAPEDPGYDAAEQDFLIGEGWRILRTFGNHPSFCLFSLGNELWGSKERLRQVLAGYKAAEKRILFTQGSNNFQFWPEPLPEEDFFVGVRMSLDRRIRGSYAACDVPEGGHIQGARPSTLLSYDPALQPEELPLAPADAPREIGVQVGTGVQTVRVTGDPVGFVTDKPVVSHEIGQYCVFPDFSEIPKYTGVLRARNLELFRERLARAGMAALASDFLQCSGRLAVQCYKEEIEAALRSQHLAGFQLLDLQDFAGQGTALVGVLNAFMESKGITDAQEWGQFCSDSVLLGRFASYCVTDHLHMDIQLRHHRPAPVHETLHCTVQRGQRILRELCIPADAEGQGLSDIGALIVALPKASAVHRITVTLRLPHTENRYTLWQFPEQDRLPGADGVCVTSDPAEMRAALSAGGSVVYFPAALPRSVEGAYCTDFWCYPMFRGISEKLGRRLPAGTLGLCIDNTHPALRAFRCERWTTPPWYDIVTHADLAILDGLPVKPIVRMIDNFERNHSLGLLFECTVGTGRLLVCTARLPELPERPEAVLLYNSLLRYAASPQFAPTARLTYEALRQVLG